MDNPVVRILRATLERSGYTIEDATKRIDTLLASGALSPEDAQDLFQIAQERARPEPLTLEEVNKALTERVDLLEECIVEIAMMLYAQ